MSCPDFWESNLRILKDQYPELISPESLPGSPPVIHGGIDFLPTPSAHWTARLRTQSGLTVFLHDERDPMAEARAEVERQWIGKGNVSYVLIAGIGLGYLAFAGLERLPKDLPLVLIIGEPLLFWKSMEIMDWGPVLKRPGTQLLMAADPREIRRRLSSLSDAYGGAEPSCILHHPQTFRLRSSFYNQVFTKPEERSWWDYPRFKKAQVKVFVVTLRSFILQEIENGLRQLGHSYRVLRMDQEEQELESLRRVFTDTLRDFQPDFILTVNHRGFDQEGVMTDLLTRYRIPFASWYVDSPHLILRHYAKNKSPYLTLFLWDKDYIPILSRFGYERMEYLPLGTDETQFHPMDGMNNRFTRLASDISFVGNSMEIKTRSVLARSGINGVLAEGFEAVSNAFRESQHLLVREMMQERFPLLFSALASLPEREALGYETGVTWRATGQYRLQLIESLLPLDPLVVGDQGWEGLLKGECRLHRELNYYQELPAFYPVSKVSFNATSRQMKEGVNQRVFDVPACRRVVLTDCTRQLEGLMEPGKEVLAYRNREEMVDLARRALTDREMYQRIAEAGYRRVLKEHTYRHRLQYLVQTMRKYYS